MLTGMLAAINRFISKVADRCQPFYQFLRKWKGFQWDEECEKASQELKEYLTQALMLTAESNGTTFFCICIDLVSFAVVVKEVRLHGADS